jgi:IclR family acetate operon transcriptional repressor
MKTQARVRRVSCTGKVALVSGNAPSATPIMAPITARQVADRQEGVLYIHEESLFHDAELLRRAPDARCQQAGNGPMAMKTEAAKTGAMKTEADKTAAERPAEGVKSVVRVFELLELITDAGGDVTLSELSTMAGLPLPTIHRLLRTLVSLGYIRQLPNRRYALGPRLVRLGEAANKQFGALALPQLKSLVDRLGETANMAMLDSDMVVYVAQVPSPHAMRMFTEVGRRAHTHDTGVGKAILAQLPDETVRSIVNQAGMPTPTKQSIGSIDALLADLEVIRERGYSIDDGEQEVGVRCFAMAIPGAPTPTAISVSGPQTRVDDAFAERAIPLLHEAVAQIARNASSI